MPPHTKKAITDSFIKIVSRKPLDKVTVRDIVDDCSVNRNTFYYYFQDVYAVVEDIFNSHAQGLSEALDNGEDMSEAFVFFVSFFEDNIKMVRSVYESSIKDNIERYVYDACEEIVEYYALRALKRQGILSSDGTLPTRITQLTEFCAHAFTGYILTWMRNGMKRDLASDLIGICELYDRNLRWFIEKNV